MHAARIEETLALVAGRWEEEQEGRARAREGFDAETAGCVKASTAIVNMSRAPLRRCRPNAGLLPGK